VPPPCDVCVQWNDVALYGELQGLKARNPALRTSYAVGGWSFSTNTATRHLFPAMVASAASRAAFIASAIAYARLHGFDGIDLDW
jgi:chitinase